MKTLASLVTLFGTTLIVLLSANWGCEAATPLSADFALQANPKAAPLPTDTDRRNIWFLWSFPSLAPNTCRGSSLLATTR
jgi:hypothetical protein